MQKKNSLNANIDTSNNQDFLDLLGLDMSPATKSTNATLNNVLMGIGVSGMVEGLCDLNSTILNSNLPSNGNDLSSIAAAASSPTVDIMQKDSRMNNPLTITTASNNATVVRL